MAFKPSASKKNKRKEEGTLNMNSMMDILTIMLLFLLMSFSTEGSLATKADGLKPPLILVNNKPKKTLSVGISSRAIYFKRDPIVDVDQVLAQKNSYVIQQLAEKLDEEASRAIDLESKFGIEFKKELVITADEKTPFNLLLKVVITAGRNQFSNLRLMGNLSNPKDVFGE
ncbi:MAG: biopolymer transporter ExbD [Bacteroidetes bacterium]|nr:biopolymer transporter ExbD [Bacteroidota bacterium]